MKDWIKLKKYVHFSKRFTSKDIPFIRSYVNQESKIVSHRFYPFIHYTIHQKRFKRSKTNPNKRELSIKKREIFYANHLDAQIFAFYARKLLLKLEDIYNKDTLLSNSVLAYRSIPFNEFRSKNNIDFAGEVFDYIRSKKEIVILCFDITNFFPSLDHSLLKQKWAEVGGFKNGLPQDHYAVYKAITNFAYVEISDLIREFPEHRIKKFKYIRNKKIECFCNKGNVFRERVLKKGLVKRNRNFKHGKKISSNGIPQGSPISAVLSNVFMLDIDSYMVNLLSNIGGLYRRYSDDIVIITERDKAEKISNELIQKIKYDLKLEVNESKVQRLYYNKDSTNKIIDLDDDRPSVFSYLGFDFNGNKILIKQKSLSRYYRSTKRMIRRRARYAYYAKKFNQQNGVASKDEWIYRTRIYRNKSHLGKRVIKNKHMIKWGNYLSYAYKASEILDERAIRKQLRNHWKIIESEIKRYEIRYGLKKQKKN